jgi:hypothetical protein
MAGIRAVMDSRFTSLPELWIGVVEVLTEPSAGAGNTRAFTNVVTWAETASDFIESVSAVFKEYGWHVLGAENQRPIANETNFSEEIAEIIKRARHNSKACIFSTFYYYPSRPS